MTSEPTDETPATDEPPPTEPVPGPTLEHRDDGLDLARAARRAAGAVPGQPTAKKRKRPTPYDAPRRRGGPRTSGAFPSDRDPQLMETAMGRLIANHGWELDLRVQSVFGRWAELVAGAEQVLVTAAVAADVPVALQGVRFVVADGEVRRDE